MKRVFLYTSDGHTYILTDEEVIDTFRSGAWVHKWIPVGDSENEFVNTDHIVSYTAYE